MSVITGLMSTLTLGSHMDFEYKVYIIYFLIFVLLQIFLACPKETLPPQSEQYESDSSGVW